MAVLREELGDRDLALAGGQLLGRAARGVFAVPAGLPVPFFRVAFFLVAAFFFAAFFFAGTFFRAAFFARLGVTSGGSRSNRVAPDGVCTKEPLQVGVEGAEGPS